MLQAVFRAGSVQQTDGVTHTVQYFLDRLYTNRYLQVSHHAESEL